MPILNPRVLLRTAILLSLLAGLPGPASAAQYGDTQLIPASGDLTGIGETVGDVGDIAEPEDTAVGVGAQYQPEEPGAVVSRVFGAQLEFARGRLELAARHIEGALTYRLGDLGQGQGVMWYSSTRHR